MEIRTWKHGGTQVFLLLLVAMSSVAAASERVNLKSELLSVPKTVDPFFHSDRSSIWQIPGTDKCLKQSFPEEIENEIRAGEHVTEHSVLNAIVLEWCELGEGYGVMPYIGGRSLQDLRNDPTVSLSPSDIGDIFRKIFETLHAMHETGLVHGDIRQHLENIIIENGTMNPYFIDFGCSQVFSHGTASDFGSYIGRDLDGYMSLVRAWLKLAGKNIDYCNNEGQPLLDTIDETKKKILTLGSIQEIVKADESLTNRILAQLCPIDPI